MRSAGRVKAGDDGRAAPGRAAAGALLLPILTPHLPHGGAVSRVFPKVPLPCDFKLKPTYRTEEKNKKRRMRASNNTLNSVLNLDLYSQHFIVKLPIKTMCEACFSWLRKTL